MACATCSSGSCSTSGCKSGGCSTGGCNKLNTFDWFGNIVSSVTDPRNSIFEVRFKNNRKGFYRNVNALDIHTGDIVSVESDRGFDIGKISLSGELVRLQMRKKKINSPVEELPKIFRVATEEDIQKLEIAKSRELDAISKTRTIILSLNLDMKLSDIEFQGDNTKAIFYYTADQRVDFRELIKTLADSFKIRVEMKQIGPRQEAGLIGGIGSCGRELCCSTWLTNFKNVSAAAARYQNISLNPLKLSGQCGRLKCCLNYELETYMDALKGIPEVRFIETEAGPAYHQKTDIFRKIMWFSYKDSAEWHALTVEKVLELLKKNKTGIKTANIESEVVVSEVETETFVDLVGQSKIGDRPMNEKRKNNQDRRKDFQNKPAETFRPQQQRPAQNQGDSPNRPKPQGQKPTQNSSAGIRENRNVPGNQNQPRPNNPPRPAQPSQKPVQNKGVQPNKDKPFTSGRPEKRTVNPNNPIPGRTPNPENVKNTNRPQNNPPRPQRDPASQEPRKNPPAQEENKQSNPKLRFREKPKPEELE
jgi:cell fate regulator YaaT (PSP1 superfamily)